MNPSMSSCEAGSVDADTAARSIYIIAPAGAVRDAATLPLACERLQTLGFEVTLDPAVSDRYLRFSGTDEARLQAFERAMVQPAEIVMAARGGYGMSRLLHRLDWRQWAESGKRFVGYSDCTAFSLGLLALTGQGSDAGPMAAGDFGAAALNPAMARSFVAAMANAPVLAEFEAGFPGTPWEGECSGTLWGGNLALLSSLVGTPYMPVLRDGILFLEDVGEAPFRAERMLSQLLHAGILQRQQAILLGCFTGAGEAAAYEGHGMAEVEAWLASMTDVPVITGLPHGHVPEIVTLPVGARAVLQINGSRARMLRAA